MSDWETCYNFMIDNEDSSREYKTVPDAGGMAISGINSNSFPLQFAKINELPQDQRGVEVENFYHAVFWNKWFDQISSDEVAKRVFDSSVNMGYGTAVKILQGVLGCQVDGRLGPNTVSFTNASPSQALVANFILARCQHYKDIVAKNPDDEKYLAVWLVRASR